MLRNQKLPLNFSFGSVQTNVNDIRIFRKQSGALSENQKINNKNTNTQTKKTKIPTNIKINVSSSSSFLSRSKVKSNNEHDWNPVNYLSVFHHKRTQKQLRHFFLNILQKHYQLSILGTLDMSGHFHQKQ